MDLPGTAWVRFNRLGTGVGRFRSWSHKWDTVMATSADCDCDAEEQTVDPVPD